MGIVIGAVAVVFVLALIIFPGVRGKLKVLVGGFLNIFVEDIANTLDGAIIQVEGNINARNYSDSGQALSAERAKAVAKYFIACGIDPNRLITVGNGNTKMVADPGSADAYLNRRTDVFFKIIEE